MVQEKLVKIPQFQRDFVWDKAQTAKLIDSIIKGFPIGTFIFWKTKERLRSIRNVGNIELPDIPKGEPAFYVLDGQQRITSLYAIRKGVRITRDGEEINYRDISINLELDPDADEEVVTSNPHPPGKCVSVFELLNGNLTDFFDRFQKEELKKIDTYRGRLTGYDFSTIVIDSYEIDTACEIFTRINTGGKELTLFEIMVAKTYDQERNFDLSEKYEELIKSDEEKDLTSVGYDTVPPITILQCVAAVLCGHISRKDLLSLDRDRFIDGWPLVKEGIFAAVDYLRSHMGVPVSKLLPYNVLLVPLTMFFVKNQGKTPSLKQHELLSQYFFWASLTQRFSLAVEKSMETDLNRIEKILAEEQPAYPEQELSVSLETIRDKNFSAGDAFCKAIICVYARRNPKSFKTNGTINVGNDWLKTTSSKNYHHFFPKAHLKARGFDWQAANKLPNITLVDDQLNKRDIKARAPSEYIQNFAEKNSSLDETLKTHFIGDIVEFGIADDDYDKFLNKRAELVQGDVGKILQPKKP